MGGLAAAVTFRKDPSLKEKAAWIVLITLVMVAEVRNLYVADREQAATFSKINSDLERTGEGLNKTLDRLDAETVILNSLPPKIDVLDPHLNKLGNQLSATDSALKSQAERMQHQDLIIRREALLNIAPHVISEMQDIASGWEAEDTADRHSRPTGKNDPEYIRNRDQRDQQRSQDLRPIMITASAVREQLIDGAPESMRHQLMGPSTVGPIFDMGRTGQTIHLQELRTAIMVMEGIVRKISTLPPDQ
jgi:hypothetical protein